MTSEADAPRPARRRLLIWAVPLGAVTVAALIGGASYLRSSGGQTDASLARDVSRSSTIAWSGDRSSLWVTSPDDDQVVELDPSSLEVRQRIAVAGQPRELTALDERIVVTGAQSTELAVIDLNPPPSDALDPGQPDVAEVPLPCGGSRAVVTVPASSEGVDRDLAVVTCASDDVLAIVDLDGLVVVGTVAVPGRPTGIVRDGQTLTVSTAGDGRLHAFALADLTRAIEPVGGSRADGGEPPPELAVEPVSTRGAWVDGGRSASTLAALDTGSRGVIGVYQVVDNERRLTREEIEAGSTYGTPKDGRARLEPAVAGACGARFSSLTDESRRLSGPVALAAAPGSELVWVVGEFSHSVSVVRCDGVGAAQRSATVASFEVGEGARGIVVADDGRAAFVDVGFDHEIAELRLPDGSTEVADDDPIERLEPDQVGRRPVEDRYLSPLAQQGRRMFNDATNTHLTPFGVVTCGSCHPSAGDDGLSWRIESSDSATREIDRKVRRTPAAWQIDPSVKPLHWDGEFRSADDLALTTIQRLLGGDGLLVDTAALRAYMAEVTAPPGRPVGADPASQRLRIAGERVLDAACASCHAGESGTDGRAHDVLAPSTIDDGALDAVITPPLTAVRGRAPYGHDGRAADLDALLEAHGDGAGGTIELSDDERAAVMAYLQDR